MTDRSPRPHPVRNAVTSPLLFAFRQAAHRDVIAADVAQWCRVKYRAPGPVERDLVMFLLEFRELRNVFYFRLSGGSASDRAAAKMLRRLWQPVAGLDLSSAEIGPGLTISHGYGTILTADRIGRNLWVHQGVTIGFEYGRGRPTIGDDVFVGAGAKILGPIHVGDGARIGANAVVVKDVPAGATMGGVPARTIRLPGGDPTGEHTTV